MGYLAYIDALFYVFGCLVPFGVVYYLSWKHHATLFCENMDVCSCIFMTCVLVLGLMMRYFVMDSFLSFTQPTLILNVLMILGFYGLRVRFIYTVAATNAITLTWFALNIYPVFVFQGAGYIQYTPRTFFTHSASTCAAPPMAWRYTHPCSRQAASVRSPMPPLPMTARTPKSRMICPW